MTTCAHMAPRDGFGTEIIERTGGGHSSTLPRPAFVAHPHGAARGGRAHPASRSRRVRKNSRAAAR
jgi:hypothetical protein